jgi:hypothetical protein
MWNSLSLTHPERENSFASNRKLWLSVGPLIVLLLFLGMYGCTRALRSGSHEAYLLAEGLHASMTKQDWKGIYENADDNFNQVITEEKSTELFSGIVRKLGLLQTGGYFGYCEYLRKHNRVGMRNGFFA